MIKYEKYFNILKRIYCGSTIYIFAQRHYMLGVAFVLSVCLVVKSSNIPFLFTNMEVIAFVFSRPTDLFWINVLNFMESYASSYVISLLFYYYVVFIPMLQREKAALTILDSRLVCLYSNVSDLLAIIKFFAKQQGIWDDYDIRKLDAFEIGNDEVWCNGITYSTKLKREINPVTNCFNLWRDTDMYRKLILSICNEIIKIPCFIECTSELRDCVSNILISPLLYILPKFNNSNLDKQRHGFFCDFGRCYNELSEQLYILGRYVSDRQELKLELTNKHDIKSTLDFIAKVIARYPVLLNIDDEFRNGM